MEMTKQEFVGTNCAELEEQQALGPSTNKPLIPQMQITVGWPLSEYLLQEILDWHTTFLVLLFIHHFVTRSCDPLNVMTEPETVIVAGTASNNSNRYGDYNAMGLDPVDGETFWFTGMYNPAANWSTRIAAFTIPACAASVQFSNNASSVNESSANVNNNCLDYSVLNIPISVGTAPTQTTTATVNITGGTATNNIDYVVATPMVTFNSTTTTGNIVIHVYNDDYVE